MTGVQFIKYQKRSNFKTTANSHKTSENSMHVRLQRFSWPSVQKLMAVFSFQVLKKMAHLLLPTVPDCYLLMPQDCSTLYACAAKNYNNFKK